MPDDDKTALLTKIVAMKFQADMDYVADDVDATMQELLDLGWVEHTNPIGRVGLRPTLAGRAELERLGIDPAGVA